MIRGTTAELTIEIEGLNALEYTDLVLLIQSGGTVEKHLADIEVDGDVVRYKLTQTESLALIHHYGTIEVLIINGSDRKSSGITAFEIDRTLKNEVAE